MVWPPTTHQDVQDEVGTLRVTPPVHSHPVTQLTASGARSSSTFLRGDGVWATPATTGTGTGTGTGELRRINVKDFGAVGDGVADDTAAINAATNEARMKTSKRGGLVFFPAGRYRITSTINLYTGVSLLGEGWTYDTINYWVSALIADPTFTGTAMVKLNADGQTVSDPTTRPDLSWHQATVERMVFLGNGKTGPHGLDVGWAGEASSVSNCSFKSCNRGIDTSNGAVSLICFAVSMNGCSVGLYASGKVQVFSISGDANGNLVYVTGGSSTNVNIFGMKAEAIGVANATAHDPVVDIVNLDGGRFHLDGGIANTDQTKSVSVVRITRTGSQIRPRVIIEGFDADAPYTYILTDTISGQNVPRVIDGTQAPTIHWNGPIVQGGGHGNILLTNGTNIKRANDNNMTAFTTMTQP